MPTIKTNGINLYYESYGEGPPLVFVSGFSCDHTTWRNVVNAYADKYQVIIFDNRGIGKTDCPHQQYTAEMMADDVVGLVNVLQLGPAHFVGHSFGGAIVQNIAYKYPEVAKSIIIYCYAHKTNMRGKLYAELRLDMIKADLPESAIVKMITILCWSEKYLKQPGKVEKLVKQGFYPISLAGYEGQLHAVTNFDSSNWITDIKCPVLVIVSDDDPFARVQDAMCICKLIPNSELYCFKDVGHVPHIEQREIFNKVVLDFLAK